MKDDAFSLVELTLALGVAAISLLAIFALLPFGIRTNQIAIEQPASADILSVMAADLRATPVSAPRGIATISPRFAIGIPANPVSSATSKTLFFTAEGQFSDNISPDSHYRVTVTFLPNGAGARTATFVDLKATWPAPASIPNAAGIAEVFVALDRN